MLKILRTQSDLSQSSQLEESHIPLEVLKFYFSPSSLPILIIFTLYKMNRMLKHMVYLLQDLALCKDGLQPLEQQISHLYGPSPPTQNSFIPAAKLYNTTSALFSWIAWIWGKTSKQIVKRLTVLCKNLCGKITGPPTSSQRQTASHVTGATLKWVPQPQSSFLR